MQIVFHTCPRNIYLCRLCSVIFIYIIFSSNYHLCLCSYHVSITVAFADLCIEYTRNDISFIYLPRSFLIVLVQNVKPIFVLTF